MDYYQRLHVRRDADSAVIEKAYKALSLKYHPDRAQPEDRPAATEAMRLINEAYSTLRDPARRATYDRTLPAESGQGAWELFWDQGLVGLYRSRNRH